VVISGDTPVREEVAILADGADVLVHEAGRASALRVAIPGRAFGHIFDDHADTVTVGRDLTTVELPAHRGGSR
jgi:ribonuclease BN (tRNA processing enzyme)